MVVVMVVVVVVVVVVIVVLVVVILVVVVVVVVIYFCYSLLYSTYTFTFTMSRFFCEIPDEFLFTNLATLNELSLAVKEGTLRYPSPFIIILIALTLHCNRFLDTFSEAEI